jgi:hypothetical protein
MQPEEFIRTMLDVYATCNSYRDKGTVKTVYNPETSGHDFDKLTTFETYFKRPDFLRFEWTTTHKSGAQENCAFWYDGKHVSIYNSKDASIDECASLLQAVARATGASDGAAPMVSSMLLPYELEIGRGLKDLKEIELVNEEEYCGEICYHLLASWIKHHDRELWLSKRDFTLRGIKRDRFNTEEERMKLFERSDETAARLGISSSQRTPPKGTIHVVSSYKYDEVLLNSEIAENVFQFRPRK